jgi:predicted transcriptional regulator
VATTRTAQRNNRKAGRPPAGINGDRVADYPQLSVRVPPEVRETLIAVAALRRQPHWRIMMEALTHYVRSLPRDQRDALEERLAAHVGDRSRERVHPGSV